MTNDEPSARPSVFEGWVRDGGHLAGPLTWFGAAVGMPLPADEDLSAEWLAWVLDQLVTEGDCILILYYREDDYGYVQFLVHDFHLHAETMSNEYTNPDRPLNDAEILHLLDLGWLPPFGTPEECDLDNSPNFNLRVGRSHPTRPRRRPCAPDAAGHLRRDPPRRDDREVLPPRPRTGIGVPLILGVIVVALAVMLWAIRRESQTYARARRRKARACAGSAAPSAEQRRTKADDPIQTKATPPFVVIGACYVCKTSPRFPWA